jgi:hypothetical protein
MESAMGIPRINIHRIIKTLDENNKVTPTSLFETMCCVTDLCGNVIANTITNNISTVTEEGYVEGSKVIIWLWCLRASEGGGMCQQIIIDADETILQTYKDSL